MRKILSADDLHHMSLPPLPDLNLALLFSLMGIHSSFPTAFTTGQEHFG
jgi:hypothetical protein